MCNEQVTSKSVAVKRKQISFFDTAFFQNRTWKKKKKKDVLPGVEEEEHEVISDSTS